VDDRFGAKSSDVSLIEGGPGTPKHAKRVIWKQNRWYYHADSLVSTIDDCTRKWFHEFLVHGTVWTGSCDNAVHRSQRLKAKPLKSLDWPRDPLGPSWPSFPSITEWMEMLRKGIDPFQRPGMDNPVGHPGFTRVSRRELNDDVHLATLIVSNYVVGVRSTTEVPSKYLKYFRYAHNFLIIVASYALPIGLVRFLLAQWCINPYSLWLRRTVTLKKFLRAVPIALKKRSQQRLVERGSSPLPSLCSSGSPSDYESDLD